MMKWFWRLFERVELLSHSQPRVNSWLLQMKDEKGAKNIYHYFCYCGQEFRLKTHKSMDEVESLKCPFCANDYFKDAVAFADMKSTKIWKQFAWQRSLCEDEHSWNITLKYEIPVVNSQTQEIDFRDEKLLNIQLQKDGLQAFKVAHHSKIHFKYSLYMNDKSMLLKELLTEDAQKHLYEYLLLHRTQNIEWIDEGRIVLLSLSQKLKYISYFLKNSHLKEHEFFYWKMDAILADSSEYKTQEEMLAFVSNHRKEKSIKKRLYKGYEEAMKHKAYHPYSDYVFARVIDNTDLLAQLYDIYPAIKEHLFTDNTFTVAREFLLFLKEHYAEKQIVRFFCIDIQNETEYKNRLLLWRDTLQLLRTRGMFAALHEHFTKQKLTVQMLHDEVSRVSHLLSYEYAQKEEFEYEDIYLNTSQQYRGFEFKLPQTVQELSLWAKDLRNCMLGYAKRVHEQTSVIYGVFKEGTLLYAIELRGVKIVQSLGKYNAKIDEDDMQIIREWRDSNFTIK